MTLLLDDFFSFWNGIYCDYDGAYGDQCFDLANAYSRWIGGQRFTGATADLIFQQPGDFYTAIQNTPEFVPTKGDIVIWNWPHVGIATGNNSDTNKFEVLEQNDPENSNCHIKIYPNYNGVIGVLRPKNLTQVIQSSTINQMPTYFEGLLQENRLDLNNESQIRTFFQQAIDYPHTKQDLDNAMTANKVQADQLASLRQDIESEQKTNNELSVQIQNLQKQLQDISTKPQDSQNPSGDIPTWTLIRLLFKKIFH